MKKDNEPIIFGIDEDDDKSQESKKELFFNNQPDIIDEYENVHRIPKNSEIARGGQGAVNRTQDDDIAIKRPIDRNGDYILVMNDRNLVQRIRALPLPNDIHISLPLANLRDVPGYVMKLLKGMKSFTVFSLNGEDRAKMPYDSIPEWLSQVNDKRSAQDLAHYANTGSTRRRLYALYKSAAILARLHNAGIVYGDVSPNNVFIGDGIPCDCWLIDADNLRLEMASSKSPSFYTPGFGAPEIVQGKDISRPRSDCWAFAVMAFQTLTLCHPFIGRMVLEPDESVGWNSDPSEDGVPADLDEQAYAGRLPFIDDNTDDSNSYTGGLYPRELVLTPQLRRLFQETFGAGRLSPHRRPSMSFWALELAKAVDNSIVCPNCQMSYFNAPNFEACPYCQTSRPPFAIARTNRWKKLLLSNGNNTFQTPLPHRLFHPFSLSSGDVTEYEVEIDLNNRRYMPVRGTKSLPSDLIVEFVNP